MVSIMKMNRKPIAALKRLMGYSAISGTSSVLAIVLICFAAAGPVFAEDLPQGVCQASNSLSVLVRGKDVKAYVPRGAWSSSVPGVAVLKIEGKDGSAAKIPISESINSCASNSVTGETVCTANDSSNVYIISDNNSFRSLKSAAIPPGPSYPAMFAEGNCTNCGVTIDPINNRAVITLNLSATPPLVEGFQILNLGGSPNFETEVRLAQNQQVSPGTLIDPIRNIILSPNQLGIFGIVKLPNNQNKKNDDNHKNDAIPAVSSPTFVQNAFPMTAFGSAGADCEKGVVLATMMEDLSKFPFTEEPPKVFIGNLNQATAGSSPGTWTFMPTKKNEPPSFQTQPLSESHLSLGSNGIALVQGTKIGVLTGEFGAIDPFITGLNRGDWITAIAIAKHTDGDDDAAGNKDEKDDGGSDDVDSPGIRDWVSCRIPGAFQIGLAPHTVAAYKSPKNGHAMAVVGNWDLAAGMVTQVAVIDLTQMLHKTKRTKEGHACALPGQSLSPGGPNPEVTFFDVPRPDMP